MTEYYSIQSSQDVIEHFGIKGMKWGHRLRGNYVINDRSASRASKKISYLKKRNERTPLNMIKDAAQNAATMSLISPLLYRTGDQMRYSRSNKIDKLQAKVNSNKNKTNYSDEYRKIKDSYHKRSKPLREEYKKSKKEKGRFSKSTKIAKLRYKSALYKDNADEWRKKINNPKTTTQEVMGYYNAMKLDSKRKKIEQK